MKKKNYEKPSIQMVVINKHPQLLAGSGKGLSGNGGFGSDYSIVNGGDISD
jgi:hypothetical protein